MYNLLPRSDMVKIRSKISMINLLLIVVLGISAFLISLMILGNLQESEEKLFEERIRNSIQDKSSDYILSINKRINDVANEALGLAAIFARDREVISAYTVAGRGNIDDAESPESLAARELLRMKFKPLIDGYLENTGSSLLKMHYHLPNTRSLVRLWREGYQTTVNGVKVDISDDLSSFRQTVKEVNTPPYDPVTGIEIGRGGFVIRGLASIDADDGTHLGSVEVLFPLLEVIQKEKEGSQSVFAVYMHKEQLEIAKSLQDPEKFPVIEDKYVLTDYTDKDVTDGLVNLEILENGSQGEYRTEIDDTCVTSFPIRDFSGVTSGVMVFAFDISEENKALFDMNDSMNQARDSFILVFSILIGIITVFGLILSFVLVNIITKPLKLVEKTLEEIASGKGDLTMSLDVKSHDEIGNLSSSFNTFIESLRNIVVKILSASDRGISTKEKLMAEVETAAASVTEISANMKSARSSMGILSETITTTRESTANINGKVSELGEKIGEQASAIEESSSAVNEMVTSINNVAGITRSKEETTNRLVEHTKKGEQIINTTTESIREIANNVESISEMVSIINGIAAQTNLLAMNAAIEAAHAGDAGKGFSVVADEIRKLAENSSGNAKKIAGEIKNIIQKINTAVTSGNETTSSFHDIRKEVESVSEAFSEILLSSTELSAGGNQLLKGIELLNEISEKVKDDSENMTENVVALTKAMDTIEQISTEITAAVEEVAVSSGEIDNVMSGVSELTNEVSESSMELKNEADRFTV